MHRSGTDAAFLLCVSLHRTEVDLVSDLNDINEYTEDFAQREDARGPQSKMGRIMEKVW